MSDLTVDQIFKGKLENIIKLAQFIGLNFNKIQNKPDFKYRLSCTIIRWYKKNPQRKKKNENK